MSVNVWDWLKTGDIARLTSITQTGLCIILAGVFLFLLAGEKRWNPVIWALPLTALALSTVLYVTYPTTGGVFWMLFADVVIVFVLILATGGSEVSCYTPLIFMVPTYGLFILGPTRSALALYGVAFVLLWFGLFVHVAVAGRMLGHTGNRFAALFVALICFGLTIVLDISAHEKLRAKELGLSYQEFQQEAAKVVSEEDQRQLVARCAYKWVHWHVEFERWVDVETGAAALRSSQRYENIHLPLMYVGRVGESPPRFRPGEMLEIEGIFVPSSDAIHRLVVTSYSRRSE